MEHLNAVILAGGSGTRLWPLSTPSFPKQFLPLPNGRSMMQESLARVEGLVSPERAWVVTGRSMVELGYGNICLSCLRTRYWENLWVEARLLL